MKLFPLTALKSDNFQPYSSKKAVEMQLVKKMSSTNKQSIPDVVITCRTRYQKPKHIPPIFKLHSSIANTALQP